MLTISELESRFQRAFEGSVGELTEGGRSAVIEVLDERRLVLRAPVGRADLRPGGSVSGPTVVRYVDQVGWMMTVAHFGPDADAVTTDLSIQFLRPVTTSELLIEATALRIGRRCVIRVDVDVENDAGPAAHAVITFAPVTPRA
jgi:uncharacterized protein (TIGR00369 family)